MIAIKTKEGIVTIIILVIMIWDDLSNPELDSHILIDSKIEPAYR